jgi:hypothetical protein
MLSAEQHQGAQVVFPWEFAGGSPIDDHAIGSMIEAISDYSRGFFDANLSTDAALKSALRLSPGGQAQIYLIPAAAAHLGNLALVRDYGRGVLKNLTTTEVREGYMKYLECLQEPKTQS